MYIQIDNVGFVNKGAQLMLYSVIDRLKQESKWSPRFIAGLNCNGTIRQIINSGLFKKADFIRLPQIVLEPYGLAGETSVDVILDAGGFQFGDPWVASYSKDRINYLRQYYRNYKQRGVKVIFLPQAFGPFENPLSKEMIEMVHSVADLIYSRETTSFTYLKSLFQESKKIRQAPDFTCLEDVDLPFRLEQEVHNGVCIIPNTKMITHARKDVADTYFYFLQTVANFILDKGEKLVLLNHEGEGDWKLIQKLKSVLGDQRHIITLNNLDACVVKAVIGHCKLLISSRFHGVVSGLNQRIPAFCTSWNHKYEELLADYGVPSNLINLLNHSESLAKIEKALIDPEEYIPKKETVAEIKVKTQKIWDEVTEMMVSSYCPSGIPVFHSESGYQPLITGNKKQKTIKCLEQIAKSLMYNMDRIKPMGLCQGKAAISLFLFHYFKLTGNPRYEDLAYEILQNICDKIKIICDDLSFSEGLSGIGWLIEYLAQNQFIENNIGDVLCELDLLLEKVITSLPVFGYTKEVISYGLYFLSRMTNPAGNERIRQKEILMGIIDYLEYFLSGEITGNNKPEKITTRYEYLPAILFLSLAYRANINHSNVRRVLDNYVNLVLQQKDLPNNQPTSDNCVLHWPSNDLAIADVLLRAAQAFDNKELENRAMEIALQTITTSNTDNRHVSLLNGTFGMAHLYNHFYQYNHLPELKKAAIYWLDKTLEMLYKQEYEAREYGLMNGLAEVGMILIDAVSDKQPTWDIGLLMS